MRQTNEIFQKRNSVEPTHRLRPIDNASKMIRVLNSTLDQKIDEEEFNKRNSSKLSGGKESKLSSMHHQAASTLSRFEKNKSPRQSHYDNIETLQSRLEKVSGASLKRAALRQRSY